MAPNFRHYSVQSRVVGDEYATKGEQVVTLSEQDRIRFARWLGSEMEVSLRMALELKNADHAKEAREQHLELAAALSAVSKHLRSVVPGKELADAPSNS